jgi:zinc protease
MVLNLMRLSKGLLRLLSDSPARNLQPARWVVLLGIFLTMLISVRAASAQGVHEATLENGLKVLIKPDRRAPSVVQLIAYRVGSVDEYNGVTGISHLLEHMMFKGTPTVASGEFSRRVSAAGGRDNAFTSRDYTGYFQQVPSARLAEMMALEADRMTQLVLSEKEFATEREVVIEERRLRTEDRARALVSEQLMASAFTASPYRHPVVGWMSDLQSVQLDDLRQWYSKWYSPGNATLVIVGDVDPQETLARVREHYGPIPARALPVRKAQTEPSQRGLRESVVKAPAETPYLLMGFKAPRLERLDQDIDPFALEMLAAVLSGDDNARLPRQLVRGERLADQAFASYDMTGRGPALFMLGGAPAKGRSVTDLRKALLEQIRRVAEQGVEESELERLRIQYVASRIYQRDSLMAQATELAGLEMIGLGWQAADRMLERIRAVQPAEVREVARRMFSEDSLTIVTLDPQPLDRKRPISSPTLRH